MSESLIERLRHIEYADDEYSLCEEAAAELARLIAEQAENL